MHSSEQRFRQRVAVAAVAALALVFLFLGVRLDGAWNSLLIGVSGSLAAATFISVFYIWLKAEPDPYATLEIEGLKKSGLLSISLDVSEEDHKAVSARLRKAKKIFFTAHTGYNAVCLLYRRALADAIANGAKLRVVVSDPEGPLLNSQQLTDLLCPSISQKKDIENVIEVCKSLYAVSSRDAIADRPAVQVALYPGVPTLNALLVDDWLRLTQYLPLLDAADAPLLEFQRTPSGELFLLYEQVFERQWAKARKISLEPPPDVEA